MAVAGDLAPHQDRSDAPAGIPRDRRDGRDQNIPVSPQHGHDLLPYHLLTAEGHDPHESSLCPSPFLLATVRARPVTARRRQGDSAPPAIILAWGNLDHPHATRQGACAWCSG